MPQILHCAGRLGGAGVRACEPFAQLVRGIGGGLAVKRHQRCRYARYPDNIGAPSILGDVRDLDQVLAAGDGFLESMNVEGHGAMDSTLM